MEVFINVGSFFLFVILQGLFINGMYESFRGGCVNDITKGKYCTGNILYMISPKFFEQHKNKYWSKPLYTCVRCMSSVWGGATFWPVVIYFFGFHLIEFPAYVFDVFVLVAVNPIIYKKI